MTGQDAAERVRRFLLSADNSLKNAAGDVTPERIARVRETLAHARAAAADPSVPQPIRELVERRLEALDDLDGGDDNT